MSKKEITHKELLTFSNLTSLEWEFVNLQAIKDGDEDAIGEGIVGDEISTQLNDLLTPEVFYREDEDADDDEDAEREYLYGADDQGNLKSEEAGLVEMRKKAGIAMEYCI